MYRAEVGARSGSVTLLRKKTMALNVRGRKEEILSLALKEATLYERRRPSSQKEHSACTQREMQRCGISASLPSLNCCGYDHLKVNIEDAMHSLLYINLTISSLS